ncbi:hypothetical protein [Blastopirellula marina]|uniref:hypothetical protein n=1 Tax=Blastopirellula marina TaxID=124 RepID=UPI0002E101B5|nr:hypothetical protein [Blastopirellula marina]
MSDLRSSEPDSRRSLPGRFQDLNLSGKYIARAIAALVAFATFVTVGLIIALTSLYQSGANPWFAALIIGSFAAVISVPFGMLLGAIVAQFLGLSKLKLAWMPRFTIAGLMFATFLCCAVATLAYYAINVASDTLPRRYLFIVVSLAMPPFLLIVVSVGRIALRWLHRHSHPYNAEVIDDDVEM